MDSKLFVEYLKTVFDDSLFGFAKLNQDLAESTECKCAVVTLMPYPDLCYVYNPIEYFQMLESLRKSHSKKINELKLYLDTKSIKYATPPASPKDDGEHFAEFSYKWAAIHAGLGFIGKNDVFVHEKFAQRVRISCLLVDLDLPVFTGKPVSQCGTCNLCVEACPHNYISGKTWNKEIKRNELIDYKKCATKSNHDGNEPYYLCAHCALACTYPLCSK